MNLPFIQLALLAFVDSERAIGEHHYAARQRHLVLQQRQLAAPLEQSAVGATGPAFGGGIGLGEEQARVCGQQELNDYKPSNAQTLHNALLYPGTADSPNIIR